MGIRKFTIIKKNSIEYFYKLTRKALKFFHKMIFSWKKHVFNVRKQNSWKLNGRKEIHITYPLGDRLWSLLYCGITRPQRILAQGKKIFLTLTMTSATLVCWEKLIVFQGKALASQTYNFTLMSPWVGWEINIWRSLSNAGDKSTKNLGLGS